MTAGLTSIIIINYRTLDLTTRLINSIKTYCDEDSYEIVLIDNGSKDDSGAVFKKDFPEINLIENRTNFGFAKAANQGAATACGEYLWFLNSDCVLIRRVFPELKAVFADYPQAAAVTPKTLDKKGRFFSVCRKFPTYRNMIFSRGSLLSRVSVFNKYSESYTMPDYDKVTEVPAVSGTALFIRREDFMKIGGFDERFFMYMEDTDLCLRLNRSGKRCYYTPKVSLVHEHRGSYRNHPAGSIYHHHLSILEYFLKWHKDRLLENIGLLFLLTVNMIFQIILNYAGLFRDNKS